MNQKMFFTEGRVSTRTRRTLVAAFSELGEIVVFLRIVAITLDVLSLDETLDALF